MTRRQDLLQLFLGLVAIASFFMGLAGCIEYRRMGVVAGYALFLSPYLSVLAIVSGVALFVIRIRPRVAPWVSLIIVVALVWARLWGPDWSMAWVSGRGAIANLLTVLILCGAAAGLLVGRNARHPYYRPPTPEVLACALCIATTTYVTVSLIHQDTATRQDYSQSTAQATAHTVQHAVTRAESLVKRLGERWSSFDHVPSKLYTQSEFYRYLRDMPLFLNLGVVDNSNNIVVELNQKNTPKPVDLAGQIKTMLSAPPLPAQLDAARESGATLVTIIEPDWRDTPIALAVAPVYSTYMNNWAVVATIDLAELIRQAIPHNITGGQFHISYGEHVLFNNIDHTPGSAIAAGVIPIPIYGDETLQFSYLYTSEDTGLKAEVLAEFVWLVGLVVTYLLVSSLRLTLVSRRHAAQLSFNALHDPLTGLPNRRMLETVISSACTRARRDRSRIAVVFLNLQGIRLINDSLGHATGDAVLKEIAQRLNCDDMPEGVVAQLGAVEFVLLMFGVNDEQAQACTQQVINKLSCPYDIDGQRITMVVSAGISTSDGYVDDPMQLVQQADLAMTKAKQLGANNWAFYSEDLGAKVAKRLVMRDQLEHAISTNALQLYYQPIVQAGQANVSSIEALLRWSHPEWGFVPPSTFVPLAENTGQIIALTEFTLTQACQDCRRLNDSSPMPIPVSVNISALYFQRADFVSDIENVLQATRLPAHLLVLEITESVFLETEKAAIQKLTALRRMGIQIAIDDFGTGYSNLSYLKNLPIDKVKIDRSFVTDIAHSTADAAIVQGIISMAHHLGLRVIAEGVEDISQLSFLEHCHCDAFQGYLFARPMPYDTLCALLREHNYQLSRAARTCSGTAGD